MNTIKNVFDIILHSNKKDSRLVARKVRKLLYSSQTEKNDFKDAVNNAPREYAKISEDWRKENFVVAISVIYYLHNKEKNPDFLFPWFLELLQHPNGVIRYAVVRMLSDELGPLTVHIRVPDEKLGELKPDQADDILHSLFLKLNELLMILWEPEYERYEYVDSLPSSPYKSVQMALVEMEYACGKEYLDNIFEVQRKWEREIGFLLESAKRNKGR